MQFASRLREKWDFYCELRKMNDFGVLNELIISGGLLDALDSEHEVLSKSNNWITG